MWKHCLQYFSAFIFQKFKKRFLWRSAPILCCKLNKIINFVLSVKLEEKIDFLQDPQKAYIFNAKRFFYFLQKKSRNKLYVGPHDTYVLFRMFFSQVNNKSFFFIAGCPLKVGNILPHTLLHSPQFTEGGQYSSPH